MGSSSGKQEKNEENSQKDQKSKDQKMSDQENGSKDESGSDEKPKERRGVPANYSKYKPVSMKLNLFRNADASFYPVQWIYSSLKCKTFDRVIEEVEDRVPDRTTRWGHAGAGVKRMFTSSGKKIETIEDLHAVDDSIIVCGGKEPFEDVGYASFLDEKPPPEKKDEGEPNYRELNKKKHGDIKRSEEQKIYNRTDLGTNKKFTVYRNGDEEFKPKFYVWRSKQTPSFDKLCDELTRIAPPKNGGKVTCMYSLDGKIKISELESIQDQGQYVASDGPFDKIEGGYDHSEIKETAKAKEGSKGRRGSERSGGAARGKDGSGNRKTRGSKPGQNGGGGGRGGRGGGGGGGGSGDEFEDSVWNDDEVLERDREMLARHYEKTKGDRRKKEDRVNEREDQIRPTNFLIYVFRNGAGQSSVTVHFTGLQLDRGMNWVQEQCAKKHKLAPKKLTTLDGQKVESVSDLINRGAYVIVALGERFRDVWYFLPAEALDTSADNEEISDAIERSRREERHRSGNGRRGSREADDRNNSRHDKRNTRSADGKSRQSDYESIITQLETRVSNLERDKKSGNGNRRRRSAESKRSDVQIMVDEDKEKGKKRSSSVNRRSTSTSKQSSKYDSLSVNRSEPGSLASSSSTNKRPSTGRPPMRNY